VTRAPARTSNRAVAKPIPAAVADGKRDVHLFGLQVDIINEKSEQLSFANSIPAVCGYIFGYIHGSTRLSGESSFGSSADLVVTAR
jgi:hypothetical protein